MSGSFLRNVNAQSKFFIGADLNVNYTALLNKDDKKADRRLNGKISVAPEAGLRLGYDFMPPHGGLKAISLGVGYFNVTQNYTGDNIDNPRSGIRNLEAKTNLNYIKIPVVLDFSFRQDKKINIIASAGIFYAYLLSYKDEMNGTSAYGSGGVFLPIHYEVRNNDYFFQLLTTSDQGKTDKFYYKKSIWGLQGSVGSQIKMNEKVSITISANGLYSFTNIENRTPIDHSGGLGTYDPWKLMLPKYYSDNALTTFNTTNRPATKILSLGIRVGIAYKL